MTNNQVNARRAEIEERKVREDERKNRRSEQQRGEELSEQKRVTNLRAAADVAKVTSGLVGNLGGAYIRAANHPWWYGLNKQLLDDVARLPFGKPLGTQDEYGVTFESAASSNTTKYAVSGHMCIFYAPSTGISLQEGESSAVNVAAKNIYAYVRHANSGHTNYEAPDLMIYLLAVDSLFTGLNYCALLYSLALEAKAENRYYPMGILNTMVNNGSDLIDAIAQYRYKLNYLITRANALRVPGNMPYSLRHMWLSSNIFKDAPVKKSQTYTFAPALLWKYNAATTGSALTAVSFARQANGSLVNYSVLLDTLSDMLDVLVSDEDIGIMSGDILKAYGEGGLMSMQPIPDTYHVESSYVMEVLQQINCATLIGTQYNLASFGVGQGSTGQLMQGQFDGNTYIRRPWVTPASWGNFVVPIDHVVLNMDHDNVSSDDVMVASRLAVPTRVGTFGSSGTPTTLEVQCCGSEIALSALISYVADGDYQFATISFGTNVPVENISVMFFRAYFAFDWAPMIRIFDSSQNYGVLCDYQNYYVADKNAISALHDVAILSEYGVPALTFSKKS